MACQVSHLKFLTYRSKLRFYILLSYSKLQVALSCYNFHLCFFRTGISQVITGYLPNLILQLFVKLVAPVMEFLSSIQGHISYSDIQRSACDKYLWFIIWNIFFANVLSGSLFKMFSVILDLQNIPSRLAVAVPAQVRTLYSCKSSCIILVNDMMAMLMFLVACFFGWKFG